MNTKDTTCRGMQSLLVDYSYGELDEGRRDAVCRHVSQCEACRRELAAIDQTRETVDDAARTGDGDYVALNADAMHADWCRRRVRAGRRWAAGAAVALALSLVLVLALAATRIELHRGYAVIRWSAAAPAAPDRVPGTAAAPAGTVPPSVDLRIKQLEQLADLIVADLIDNRRLVEQASLRAESSTSQLRRRLETLEAIRANDERRWLVLGQTIEGG